MSQREGVSPDEGRVSSAVQKGVAEDVEAQTAAAHVQEVLKQGVLRVSNGHCEGRGGGRLGEHKLVWDAAGGEGTMMSRRGGRTGTDFEHGESSLHENTIAAP